MVARNRSGNPQMSSESPSSYHRYCATWASHQSNLSSTIKHLFLTGALTDVTLSCDGRLLKCHKIVLVAGSLFFRNLFMTTACQSSVFVMNIHYREMKTILEFMYNGHVDIALDQMDNLSKAAVLLGVKGLERIKEEKSKSIGIPAADTTFRNSEDINVPFNERQTPLVPAPPKSTSSKSSNSESENSGSGFKKSNTKIPKTASSDDSAVHFKLNSKTLGNQEVSENDSQVFKFNNTSGSMPESEILQSRSSDSSSQFNMNMKQIPKGKRLLVTDSNQTLDLDKVQSDHERLISRTRPTSRPPMVETAASVPRQKFLEKRRNYKQYAMSDLLAAVKEVKDGERVFPTARKYRIPSRTLYAKVKELGGRPEIPVQKMLCPFPPSESSQDRNLAELSDGNSSEQQQNALGEGIINVSDKMPRIFYWNGKKVETEARCIVKIEQTNEFGTENSNEPLDLSLRQK